MIGEREMQKGAIEDTSEKEGSLGKVEDCGDRRFGLWGVGSASLPAGCQRMM